MRRLVTFCAVVALCAPVAAQAQGRGRGRDEARVARDDERGGEKRKDKKKEKCERGDKEKSKGDCEHHDNGRHLALGHDKHRGRGHQHDDADDDRDEDRRDRPHRCVDADRDGRCDFRADSSRIPGTTPTTTPRSTPFPLPAPRPTPTPLPAPAPVPTSTPPRSPSTTPSMPRSEPTGSRSALPEMVPVSMIEQKRHTPDQERWLGTGDVPSRYVDANKDGIPERIDWLDRNGWVVQIWRDDDQNGRANSVAMYQRGQIVRVVRE